MKRGVNKKGVELSTNAIIIFVLAALALAVLAYFFLSGTGKTTGTIADIFRTSTAGVTRTLAIESCQQRCDQIQDYSYTSAQKSAFCTRSFYIDDDGDGQADTYGDKNQKKSFYCYTRSTEASKENLDVICTVGDRQLDCVSDVQR